MPGAIKFTMTLTEEKGNDSTATLYDWTQTANISAVEYQNGSAEHLLQDKTNTVTGTNSDVYAYKLKNGKPTDITLIKVDSTTQTSIGGAKFCLKQREEYVDLSELDITAINGGTTILPENYDNNGTTIKVVTVPEGGIKIAGLADGDYSLVEVAAPAGYVIAPDSIKTFTTENGLIIDHTDEEKNINFKVANTPGVELPSTGGPGAALYTAAGLSLMGIALWMLLRRKKQTT